MKKSILIYGTITGSIVIGTMCIGFATAGAKDSLATSQWVGYLIMLLGFSLIFVAIKQHRDRDLGGIIKFGRALLLGLGISVVAALVYMAGCGTHFLT